MSGLRFKMLTLNQQTASSELIKPNIVLRDLS